MTVAEQVEIMNFKTQFLTAVVSLALLSSASGQGTFQNLNFEDAFDYMVGYAPGSVNVPIAKAFRGAFNNLKSPSMASYAIRAAVERAGIEAGEIEDLVMGTAMLLFCAALAPSTFLERRVLRVSPGVMNLTSDR